MIRTIACLLALAGPAAAQQIAEVDLPESVGAALVKPEYVLEGISAWPVDWTARENPDFLVQAAYVSVHGGNQVYIFHRIVSLDPGGPVLGAEFQIPGYAIERADAHPAGVQVTMFAYRDGDPRCCPSGRQAVVIQRPAQ